MVEGSTSKPFPLPWDVPQESVIGPLFFILYSVPLGQIINSHRGVQHVIYADDTQMYLIMRQSDRSESIERLKDCVQDVKTWSARSKLQLNEAKTEMLPISSEFRKQGGALPSVELGGECLNFVDCVRDLGVTVDNHLTLTQHIRNTCRAASWGISKIGRIRKYLDISSTERLVHAFVTSHLDYCNSLLAGLPYSHIAPLQRIQNTAARLIQSTSHQ